MLFAFTMPLYMPLIIKLIQKFHIQYKQQRKSHSRDPFLKLKILFWYGKPANLFLKLKRKIIRYFISIYEPVPYPPPSILDDLRRIIHYLFRKSPRTHRKT